MKTGLRILCDCTRAQLLGWGEEGRLVRFPIVTNIFCIELKSYTAPPTLLVQYCVSLGHPYNAARTPKIVQTLGPDTLQ